VVDDPLHQLSEMQRNCLELVAMNRTSKEIAQETGLSHQTVDQYLSRAAAVLGVSSRREAARRDREFNQGAFKQSEFRSAAVATPEISGTQSGPIGTPDPKRRWKLSLNVPGIGGTRHDLGPVQVLYAILRVSLFTMGAVGAIIAIVFWLNRLML
jgi:DNA-binding CsgD family transcriptional regulator